MTIESTTYCGSANPADISGALQRNSGTLAAGEVDLNEISAGHLIRIETLNSVYRFVVSDSDKGLGVLKGGVLGEEEVIGALTLFSGADASSNGANQKLKPGSRAVFMIRKDGSTMRIITSRITSVSCIIPR